MTQCFSLYILPFQVFTQQRETCLLASISVSVTKLSLLFADVFHILLNLWVLSFLLIPSTHKHDKGIKVASIKEMSVVEREDYILSVSPNSKTSFVPLGISSALSISASISVKWKYCYLLL